MTKAERKSVIDFYLLHDWSFQLVADHFGLTRNQVAGLMFRYHHPYSERVNKLGTKVGRGRSKLGTGYRGPGPQPLFTAQNTRDMSHAT